MGQFYGEIPEFLRTWILQQKVFWVATAPLSGEGHVNLSPKGGLGTFHIVDKHTVWYEDVTGSGAETISHIRENGRITILFNAFEGPPRIARLFGKGTVYEFDTPEYAAFLPPDKRRPGSRAVIVIAVHRVGSSCGYGIPFFDYRAERTKLDELSSKHECIDNEALPEIPENGLKSYWRANNAKSIDGLPGLQTAHHSTTRFETCGVPVKSCSPHAESLMTKELRAAVTMALMVGLAFCAGILLSAQVYCIAERFGELVVFK